MIYRIEGVLLVILPDLALSHLHAIAIAKPTIVHRPNGICHEVLIYLFACGSTV